MTIITGRVECIDPVRRRGVTMFISAEGETVSEALDALTKQEWPLAAEQALAVTSDAEQREAEARDARAVRSSVELTLIERGHDNDRACRLANAALVGFWSGQRAEELA